MTLGQRLERLVDQFGAAEGPPPERLLPFARWALSGSGRILGLALAIATLAGASEMVAAWYTGRIIDMAESGDPGAFWALFGPMIAFGLVLGSIAVAAAVAFGVGGRDVAAEQFLLVIAEQLQRRAVDALDRASVIDDDDRIDGRVEHAVLVELFTDEGVGTLIRA
mgnify:CR=1 FL=1